MTKPRKATEKPAGASKAKAGTGAGEEATQAEWASIDFEPVFIRPEALGAEPINRLGRNCRFALVLMRQSKADLLAAAQGMGGDAWMDMLDDLKGVSEQLDALKHMVDATYARGLVVGSAMAEAGAN